MSDTLIVECYVHAASSEVFCDLTVPERLLRWWGDRWKWWLTSAEVELRPGGRFWLLWENTKGETNGMGGHFKAIYPDQGLVISFVGSHAKDHVDEVTSARGDAAGAATRAGASFPRFLVFPE